MLPGLRHRAIVGGNDEQSEVDSRHARKHIVDEPFMTGHVYKSDGLAEFDRQIGEAEIDRHASLFLFGHRFKHPIVTQVVPLHGAFFPAESEHRHFLDRHPTQGYIANIDIPLLKGFMAGFPEFYTKEIK
jgi:hypothetical protein